MYSPRIREDLIPLVYQTAKQAGVPMTTWVNRLIENALAKEDVKTLTDAPRDGYNVTP